MLTVSSGPHQEHVRWPRDIAKIISGLSEPRALNLEGDVEVHSVMLLTIVMIVLVGALCHQQGEWLGLQQQNASLTDGNARG